jgi:hypothetical protein
MRWLKVIQIERVIKMKAKEILQQAQDAVDDRQTNYGEPQEMLQRFAKITSLIVGEKVTPQQAGLILMGLKITRLIENPNHLDSIVDVAGYAGVLGQAVISENVKKNGSL